MMIAKVGQVVLFRTMTGEDLAALVVAVWADGAVNLCVFDRDGSTFARHGVTLVRGREVLPLEAHFAQFDAHMSHSSQADSVASSVHAGSVARAEAGCWASLHSTQPTDRQGASEAVKQ